MQADISGSQRKVVASRVMPLGHPRGQEGIPMRDGMTLPFTVSRSWSAPAGTYAERFYLIDPKSREVYLEGPPGEGAVWGLQGLTEFTDTIIEPVPITPGSYALIFSLGGLLGGEVPVEVFETPSEEAA